MQTTVRRKPRKPVTCGICTWVWVPLFPEDPIRCPNCHSTAWKRGHRRIPTNPQIRAEWEAKREAAAAKSEPAPKRQGAKGRAA